MRLRTIVLLVCFGLVGTSFPAIRIIENTSKKFTFEWTTDNLRIVQGTGAPASVSFAGENVDLGDNGEPVVPGYSMYVGVPRQGSVSVRFVATGTHEEQLKRPLRLRDAPGLGPRYPGLHFTGPWISDPQYVMFGRLRSGRFIIRPFLYDKESNTVRVLDKAQCTIEFPPASQAAVAPAPPASDFVHMVKRLVLNYQVAAGWTAAAGMPKRAAVKEFPLVPQQASQNMISFRVGDGHSGLNEGTIDENGIIRIMASDIVNILGFAPSMDQVALYASYKGVMETNVPELAQLPDGVSEVPLLRFDVNKNGLADSSDYFLAYVSSISDWRYDTSSAQYFYKVDPYDDYRHYWITVKKSSALTLIKMGPVAGAAADTFTSLKGHCYLKKSVWPSASQGINGGLEWAWARLNYYMPSFSIDNFVLPNLDPAAACSLQVGVGYSLGAPVLNLNLGGSAICQACQYNSWYPVTTPNNRPLTLTILPGSKDDTLELKNVEFRYTQKLDMSNTAAMTVFSPERPGIVRYRLGGLTGDLVYIVRIANGDASMALVDTVRTSGTFEWSDTAGIGVRYYLCKLQGVNPAPQMAPVAPKSSTDFTVRDLRGLSSPIDYLIVSHPNFIVQAQRLARHKRNIGRFLYPKAISITDIYDQFSGGNTDPAALRNALMYVRDQVSTQWNTSFDYVVLMGLGHYDFRNIATPDTSFIPVAIFRDKCLEDFFVCLQPGENPESSLSTPDCFLGRIPCQTAQDAAQVVDKIIQTEDPSVADFSGWRNRVILVADDDMQGLKVDPLGTQHVQSSEAMDTIIGHLQPAVDMRKVYLFEYEWNSLHEKPEANQAIINGINNGTAIVNYFGHGSAEVWADEHVLLPENIGNMQNNGQYPLISSFSCAVGKFDQPGKKRSLAEYLVLASKCAAIATISAMREAYANDNQKLAGNFFSSVFDTSDTASRTLGEALALAKSQTRDENEKVYSYLGDPSIQTLRPARKVSLSITDNGGKALDTLKALMQVTVKGTIMQTNGTPDAQFGTAAKPANVLISMFNPAFITWRKDNGQNLGLALTYASYKMPGAPIFAGQAQVVNGTFEQRILIPKNVTFDIHGANLTAYAWNGPVVALGNKNDFLFHGFVPMSITDTTGPTISVRPVYSGASAGVDASASKGASSTDRITAPLPFTIEIMLFDSNGIDIVSTGPDEGLTFEVQGVVARKNINYKFQFSQGDYRRGEAGWTFNDGAMSPGTYTMLLSAQDLLGNVSKKSIALEITAPLELALYHVFNYPNPMRMGESCRFYFDLSKTVSQSVDDRVKVSIRLFTLSGRLVRVFNDVKRGEPFDGKDNFNNPLSPGVYLYQMIAEDMLQQKVVKSKIEKLAINPPR